MIDHSGLPMRAIPLLFATALLGAGCAQIKDHKGYVADSVLIDSIAPGIDNRDSVTKTLGRPSFASEFDGGATWYYIARETKQYAFNNPRPVSQVMLTVRYNRGGDVTSVQRTGLETVRRITPYGRTTPTLGRSSNFLNSLFGNIGAGGANAGKAPTSDNPGG